MESKMFGEYSLKERKAMLDANADKVQVQTYQKPLTNDEITERKDKLSRNVIEVSKHDDVLKEHRENHKQATKPLIDENKVLMQEIKTGGTEVTEEVYMIADQEVGMMGVYSADGALISTRPLYENERQYSITHDIRKVSNE